MPEKIGDKVDSLFELRTKKADFQKQLTDLNKQIEEAQRMILEDMVALGIEKVSTDKATASLSAKNRFSVKDSEQFYKWIVANDKFEMAQKRLSSAAVEELFIGKNQLPDGVEYYVMDVLHFRKK